MSACPCRIEIDVERRLANALNLEVGTPMPRCMRKPPEHWGESAPPVSRWLASGGSALVLGVCDFKCPKT
jgi:hypothetical protein